MSACSESPSLAGRTVAVVGAGHVGARLARGCVRAGARVSIADVDPRRKELARELGARWITPERAMEANVDVLAPCALGGVLHPRSVKALRCRIIAGAANNQLADDGVAELLLARGVVWAPDFVVNAGGIINIVEEFTGYSLARARRRVRGIANTLALVLDDADRRSVTTLRAAEDLAARRLREAESGRSSRGANR